MDKINYKEADKLDEIEKKLIQEFKQQFKNELRQEQIKRQTFEPITVAIGKVEEKIGDVLNENKNLMGLVPVVNQMAEITLLDSSEEDDFPSIEKILPLPSSTPLRPIRERIIPEQSTFNVVSPNTLNVKLGPIALKYLPRAKDYVFGLYWDKYVQQFKIGDKITTIDMDDIIVDGEKFVGTPGLWRLLSYKEAPEGRLYSDDDLKNYSKILWKTNSIYKNNDPSTKKPKSSKGDKYKNLIKEIWKNKVEGSGVRKYSENKIEYRYIDDLNKLDGYLNFIISEEMAGNNNYSNEKKAIKDFICNKLDELIEKPYGAKYLKRTLSLIPVGSGLVNDLINNLPFELHVPNYEFLGPGTKLDMRLKRGDTGINDLDKAALKHDKFYRDHKDTESRHIADKQLQDEAWGIAMSDNHDFLQRLVALPTAGTMWMKRKFGMGLEENLKF